jgi:hypothetical protein
MEGGVARGCLTAQTQMACVEPEGRGVRKMEC